MLKAFNFVKVRVMELVFGPHTECFAASTPMSEFFKKADWTLLIGELILPLG